MDPKLEGRAAIDAVGHPADLTNPAAAQGLVDATGNRFGRLEVLLDARR